MALSRERIILEAKELGCQPAALIAVDSVESGGRGFFADGKTPIILFEPHIFWKELKKRGIDPYKYATKTMSVKNAKGEIITLPCDDPKNPILYPTWVPGLYGPSTIQHQRLARAVNIDRDSALSAASWGRYQILGQNYKLAGCATLQEFINKIYRSEDDHLDLFAAYIKNTGLDDELRQLDWRGLAAGYNGPLYWRNNYDKKLAAAYKKAIANGW